MSNRGDPARTFFEIPHVGVSMNITSTASTLVGKAPEWSIVISVLMILAGILAIVVPPVAGIAVTVFVAWLLVFSGLLHFAYAWRAQAAGILWEILLAMAYTLVGLHMLINPTAGMVSLTLALAVYLFVESIVELVLALRLRPMPGTGWLFVDGILTLILAIMIWRTWPSSTDWVLGVLVGISMLFSGITRLMISLAARRFAHQTA